MLPSDCGNRGAGLVVSLLHTDSVRMGDNMRLMLPVVRGGGGEVVSHILMPTCKYLHSLVPIKPQSVFSIHSLLKRDITLFEAIYRTKEKGQILGVQLSV